MSLIHTEAVVLRRRRAREADAIYLLYTEKLGKVTAKARGVTKTESRLAGILQPYNHIHVILYSKHDQQDILTITQASLVRHHPSIQNSLTKLSLAACAAELLDACTPDAEAAHSLWTLLTKLLAYWDEHDASQAQLAAFALRVLQLTGFEPHLSSCAACGRENCDHWYYLPHRGGVVCPACRGTAGIAILEGSLKLMRGLAAGRKLSSLPFREADVRQVLLLLDEHLGYHVGRHLKALRFLRDISPLPPADTRA